MAAKIQVAVAKTFGEGAKFEEARHASGGFLSSVQFLTVTKADGGKVSAVLKVPDVSKIDAHYEKMNAADRPIDIDFINAAHDNEAICLKILADFKKSTGELGWMPEVYAAATTDDKDTGGHIFVEDLSDRATVPDDIKPQPESMLNGAIDALADLAYLSFAQPDLLTRLRPFMKIYDIVMPDVKVGLGYLHDNYPEIFPATPQEILDKFDFKKYLDEFVVAKEKRCPVLVHRDVFPRNILVDKSDHSKFVTHLDWQLGGVGRPGEDLSRLLTTSLDPADRRSTADKYLQHYYEAAKKRCLKHGLDMPFTMADVRAGYEGSFGYSTLLFCNVSTYCLQEVKGKVPEKDCELLVARCYGCAKDAFDL